MGPVYPAQLVLRRFLPSSIFAANAVVIAEYSVVRTNPPAAGKTRLRWAESCDADLFAETTYSSDSVRRRLSNGDRCVIAQVDGALGAYSWFVADGFDQSDWLRVVLPPRAVWGSDLWVSPDFRGQGLHAVITEFTHSEFCSGDVDRILMITDVLNSSSQRAMTKAGAKFHRSMFYVRVFGLTYLRIGAVRRLGLWHRRRRFALSPELYLLN